MIDNEKAQNEKKIADAIAAQQAAFDERVKAEDALRKKRDEEDEARRIAARSERERLEKEAD